MSYEISAFIGRQERLPAVEGAPMQIVSLAQGMALVPRTLALSGWLRQHHTGVPRTRPGFEFLSEPVYQLGVRLSAGGAVAYVEGFDFGNVGGQSAIVWSDGRVVMEPLHSFNAIDRALRLLGVEKGGQYDEFDALGLGRHRKTERWIE